MSKVLKKDKQNRAADKPEINIRAYTITPETAFTAFLLLDSNEHEVLLQTLKSVTKFGGQCKTNCQLLYNMGAFPILMRHFEHVELNIRRFAMKAVAQMCQLPKCMEVMLTEINIIPKLVDIITQVQDVFILEFAFQTLYLLSQEVEGCCQLMDTAAMQSLFNVLKHNDPDVQKLSLQIIHNLINEPASVEQFVNSPIFAWPPIFEPLKSKFIGLQQLAMGNVNNLICRYDNKKLRDSFRESHGLQELFAVLECYDWHNIHIELLNVLKNFLETEDNATHFYQIGGEAVLERYMKITTRSVKPHCMAVLTKVSCWPIGREGLYENEVDSMFCTILHEPNFELYTNAATCVASMSKKQASASRMMDADVVAALTNILINEKLPWFDIRMNCIIALGCIGKGSVRGATLIMDTKPFNVFRAIASRGCSVPIEVLHLIMQTYILLQRYYVGEDKMKDQVFIQELLPLLLCNDIKLKSLVCDVLRGLMVNAKMRQYISGAQAEPLLEKLLKIDHCGLRTAVCRLIAQSVNYESAIKYLDLGTVHYMAMNKHIKRKCPAWETALEAIFKNNLSAKFAYIGRLEINEKTRDGFYVSRHLEPTFLTLERLQSNLSSPRSPIYVCNFEKNVESHISMDTAQIQTDNKTVDNAIFPFTSKVLPSDPFLKKYMKMLNERFCDHFSPEENTIASSIGIKAKMLAQFVYMQMCGLSLYMNCSCNNVELHVNELKKTLSSNVIPLGYVGVGGHLERSLLYKVMADQLGVPCALVRANFGQTWCEVALPDGSMYDTQNVDVYPAFLLRPNYVVDLMDIPGRFLAIGSADAAFYCGEPHCQPYVTIPKAHFNKCQCNEEK